MIHMRSGTLPHGNATLHIFGKCSFYLGTGNQPGMKQCCTWPLCVTRRQVQWMWTVNYDYDESLTFVEAILFVSVMLCNYLMTRYKSLFSDPSHAWATEPSVTVSDSGLKQTIPACLTDLTDPNYCQAQVQTSCPKQNYVNSKSILK